VLEYKPVSGYFDLSEKPKGMNKTTHKKVQNAQMNFIREAKKYRDPRVREANWVNFQKLQHYMAELQFIILQYWPHEKLFGR
jgi:hypothetical protein